jgi:hypothetical protein
MENAAPSNLAPSFPLPAGYNYVGLIAPADTYTPGFSVAPTSNDLVSTNSELHAFAACSVHGAM